MATSPTSTLAQLIAPVTVVAVVGLMIVPLPPLLLDLLLSVDIGLSVVLLLTADLRPAAGRLLGLPVAAARPDPAPAVAERRRARASSCCTAQEGVDAAGHVIMAFGQFVVGGNFVVGVVVFLVLIAIQYIVINHGAVRISEVTARFTLDAMPGKQMSIDADLNAGIIDEHEAQAPPRADPARGRLLRRDGRRHPLHAARRARRAAHHGRQHHRRPDHRRRCSTASTSRRPPRPTRS